MTPQQNNDAEWYRTLGRIEQGVEDLRALLLQNQNAAETHRIEVNATFDEAFGRIESLERSRTWAKAWIAGALALWTALAGFSAFVYQFVRKH